MIIKNAYQGKRTKPYQNPTGCLWWVSPSPVVRGALLMFRLLCSPCYARWATREYSSHFRPSANETEPYFTGRSFTDSPDVKRDLDVFSRNLTLVRVSDVIPCWPITTEAVSRRDPQFSARREERALWFEWKADKTLFLPVLYHQKTSEAHSIRYN